MNEYVALTLDLVGTFVFALTGALVAVRNRLDIFGTLVLAVATGLGGGLVRDVLLGEHGPVDARGLQVRGAAHLQQIGRAHV